MADIDQEKLLPRNVVADEMSSVQLDSDLKNVAKDDRLAHRSAENSEIGEDENNKCNDKLDYEDGDFKNEKSAFPFHKYLTNPLMLLLDDVCIKSNNILDSIFNELTTDDDDDGRQQSYSNIPLILQGCGSGLKETTEHIENLIQFENYDPDHNEISKLIPANLHEIDNLAGLSIVSHSLGAYVSVLEAAHLKYLATKIVTDISLWISRMFRYPDSAAHFHEDEKEGILKICQLAMHKKFPKYSTDGFVALYNKPPVIYISSSAKHNMAQHICHQLGLPLSSICTVPCTLGKMDIPALKKLVDDDVTRMKTPVIVIAFVGTPLLGRCDDLNELREICRQYDLWLHLEGCGLSLLTLPTVPGHLQSASICNSMTLNMAAWLALPALPFVTLFRSPDIVLSRLVALSTFNVRFKLNCTPLWLSILNLGYYKTLARFQFHYKVATMIYNRLKSIEIDNELAVFDLESPSVVFKYQIKRGNQESLESNLSKGADSDAQSPSPKLDSSEASPSPLSSSSSSSSSSSPFGPKDSYCDTLNIWLADMLKHAAPDIHISVVDVDDVGMCMRYAPLESSYGDWTLLNVTQEDVDNFLDCLEQNINVIDATVAMKKEFNDIIQEQDNIRLVELQTWAGLGAVQYVPDNLVKFADELSEEAKNEVNSLNQQIVQQLKSSDSAFSLGLTENEVYCIRFGLVTRDTDLEELIGVVIETGKKVEESSKYLETMADVVKKGIEKAAEDLEKENREKLLQEGLLRQVPLVSSLINWWSPAPKDVIKGRTFDLTSGKIVSTEEIYKSGIQILEHPVPNSNQPIRDHPSKFSLKRKPKPVHHTTEAAVSQNVNNNNNNNNNINNNNNNNMDNNINNNNSIVDKNIVKTSLDGNNNIEVNNLNGPSTGGIPNSKEALNSN
ncbi:hypothetical protein HELRODRAFT_94509 [Helobdella robusta]|uniref:Pyridoxal-dependent decarboxylase domain-containing protein 1 n=1 Tax=Helobdella robusta TaxID=6412 RepID=T1G914_HELRO|nr:hypothetical protein HELRODRAFT_94509 [Helobdella robusta]ESO02316.1 hypothetical protein HELRODRAFT_94509 [Helobdella robusta]